MSVGGQLIQWPGNPTDEKIRAYDADEEDRENEDLLPNDRGPDRCLNESSVHTDMYKSCCPGEDRRVDMDELANSPNLHRRRYDVTGRGACSGLLDDGQHFVGHRGYESVRDDFSLRISHEYITTPSDLGELVDGRLNRREVAVQKNLCTRIRNTLRDRDSLAAVFRCQASVERPSREDRRGRCDDCEQDHD